MERPLMICIPIAQAMSPGEARNCVDCGQEVALSYATMADQPMETAAADFMCVECHDKKEGPLSYADMAAAWLAQGPESRRQILEYLHKKIEEAKGGSVS